MLCSSFRYCNIVNTTLETRERIVLSFLLFVGIFEHMSCIFPCSTNWFSFLSRYPSTVVHSQKTQCTTELFICGATHAIFQIVWSVYELYCGESIACDETSAQLGSTDNFMLYAHFYSIFKLRTSIQRK